MVSFTSQLAIFPVLVFSRAAVLLGLYLEHFPSYQFKNSRQTDIDGIVFPICLTPWLKHFETGKQFIVSKINFEFHTLNQMIHFIIAEVICVGGSWREIMKR